MNCFLLDIDELLEGTECETLSLNQQMAPQFLTQIREQMSVPDLYVVTVAFLALKKNGFSEINFFSKNFFEKF